MYGMYAGRGSRLASWEEHLSSWSTANEGGTPGSALENPGIDSAPPRSESQSPDNSRWVPGLILASIDKNLSRFRSNT